MMKVLMSAAIAVVLVVGSSGRARADVFNVNATLTDGVTLGGTVTINTTTGAVEAANITASVPVINTYTLSAGVAGTPNYQGTNLFVIQADDNNNYPLALLGLQESSLVGFNGGAITTGSGLYTDASTRYGVISGSITRAVPEPSSLVMSGMGLAAGCAGFALRRYGPYRSSRGMVRRALEDSPILEG
jgi:hypothetical protein